MMAPLVDRALEWLQSALRLKTKRGAFLAVVAVCITFALLLFGLVVLLWS